MKFAVVQFPGSNCDQDLVAALRDVFQQQAVLVDYRTVDLTDYAAVLLPGGFSYGDYLRGGAIARFAPIMTAVREFAAAGGLVIGICNGFQILTEAGLLPGVLQQNHSANFICQPAALTVVNNQTSFTNAYQPQQPITLPIAHGEGNYYCDAATLAALKAHQQIVFTYQDNPNGSVADIAGITNRAGNVLGMMPHPERAVEALLGSEDGRGVFQSMLQTLTKKVVPA
ncbi:phosphoribosylformylglycinamidine synthase subunit PurQ [Loigolactobacillus coryniformis]|jgi:phosphoribosylformylglycinamidine synthase|uniref:Phosphoribosylformylglycinamidine synthase subunit PurQ n=1 Tax=Loigolactobacillus coryniformis subsp. coryniformis KCTC 3167 = DSM 20001 TaxID=913848 RepID=A0A0R1F9V0_9LACO|nr:phosphoribosylformylglycinamidine synthase subunit PurQ [Loigolactobacillus coryniformis]ATO55322.1 phosphoribosylformylglycinamidine synthase I [Loigolactobacillus coryniformis subsp. coryniformis KCTC 3167 = DSM 20001]KRK15559.1 phosphoribosylformylglycinamidine synthase domain-containing protein [Loigolactobacillus coryniformis subsp. coryniformis KCTC 3167 = DSM 20001]